MATGITLTGLTTAVAANEQSPNEQNAAKTDGPATTDDHGVAPDDQQTDPANEGGPDAAGQDGTANDTDDHEAESADAGEDGAGGASTASISFSNHETDGGTVTVSSVTMSEGGFVSIHDQRRFQGQVLGSIIGITGYLEPGTHTNVTVPLFTPHATAPGPAAGQDATGLTEAQQLIAIPHHDGNDSGVFEGEPDPAYEDGPRALGQFPVVNDVATVSVVGSGTADQQDASEQGTQL